MFYHIQFELKSRKKEKPKEFILDLSEEDSNRDFIEPYKSKKEIFINNNYIGWGKLEKLTVLKTTKNSNQLIQEVRDEARKGKPWMLFDNDFEKLATKTEDKIQYRY